MPTPSFDALLALVPAAGEQPDWDAITTLWPSRFAAMAVTPQDQRHHGEGDVLTHTRMVVSALIADPDWQALPAPRRAGLFWTAVLHDIGKPATTEQAEDGSITSKGHSRTGALIARELLRAAGAPFAWREEICGLIASHQLPFWLIEREDPARLAMQISWSCNTADLCLHARADARGRIAPDISRIEEAVMLSRLLFEEAGCLGQPRAFANDGSRIACFTLPDRDPDYVAHEDYTCTATLMSGLPGSGKDSWIARHAADLPVISLDAIRDELGITATDNQGQVIQEARERARGHLRAGQDFVWNATNITRQMREPLLALCRAYGARTRIVYVEVPPDQHARQNRERAAAVPEAAMAKLAAKLEPPTQVEAHEVIYAVPR